MHLARLPLTSYPTQRDVVMPRSRARAGRGTYSSAEAVTHCLCKAVSCKSHAHGLAMPRPARALERGITDIIGHCWYMPCFVVSRECVWCSSPYPALTQNSPISLGIVTISRFPHESGSIVDARRKQYVDDLEGLLPPGTMSSYYSSPFYNFL